MKTAILVDAAFYLIRHRQIFGDSKHICGKTVANDLYKHCLYHIDKQKDTLYRIYIYDSEPLEKRVQLPISKRNYNFNTSDTYTFRKEFHKQIRKLPNFALRLGTLDDKYGNWELKNPKMLKKLISGEKNISDLTDEDFRYSFKQKGVDIKIGLDIATLTHKQFVERIVLISGDSDFVPAAKHARREGVHFQLDPMYHNIKEDLLEHIDRLKSSIPKHIAIPKTKPI